MVQIGDFLVSLWLVVLIVLGIGFFVTISIVLGIRAHKGKIEVGAEELIGRKALVKTALNPKGNVFIEGEFWAAISESGQVAAGEEVIITKVEGMTLFVSKK